MSHVFLHIPVFSHGPPNCDHSQLDLPFSINISITLTDLPMSIIIYYNHSHICAILLSALLTLTDLPIGITISITLTYFPISITTVTITLTYLHTSITIRLTVCTNAHSKQINKLFLVVSLFLLVNFQHLLKEDYSVA